jgi:hypothetical protein
MRHVFLDQLESHKKLQERAVMSMPDALPMEIALIAPPIQLTTLILATPITITLFQLIPLHCNSFLMQTIYQTLSNRSLATTSSTASGSLSAASHSLRIQSQQIPSCSIS